MSFFRDYDGNRDWTMIFWCIAMIPLMISLIVLVILNAMDGLYVRPIADNNANNYCRELGFDQYKDYSRLGLLSENPIAIKCEYAERYTDLGVRTTPSN